MHSVCLVKQDKLFLISCPIFILIEPKFNQLVLGQCSLIFVRDRSLLIQEGGGGAGKDLEKAIVKYTSPLCQTKENIKPPPSTTVRNIYIPPLSFLYHKLIFYTFSKAEEYKI
jgi:hypothetical protein